MKLGIIFKKEFQEEFGNKIELSGDEIMIKREWNDLLISVINYNKGENMDITKKRIPVDYIQLIYFGGWND